jgi:hypothetical protein
MDLIGCASYGLPFLGEVLDVIWAPISAIIFYFTFRGRIGVMGAIFDFTEEILPGTDIIPSFTIAWFLLQAQRSKTQKDKVVVQKRSFFNLIK